MKSYRRIRHIAEVNPSSPKFDRAPIDSRLPFLPMERIWPGRIDLTELRLKSQVATGYTRFESGDVLLPKITPTFEAGRAIVVPDLLGGFGAGTTAVHVVRPTNEIDRRYLAYIFNSREFLESGESEMYGVAGQRRVPDQFVRNWRVNLPGLSEQRAVADLLDGEECRVSDLREALLASRSVLLERRRAGIFGETTGRMIPERKLSSLAWVESIPAAWRAVKLSLVAKLGSGHTPSRSRSDWWVNCNIPWITTGEVAQMRSDRLEVIEETRECISREGLLNSSAEVHPEGTVVLCRTAASAGYSAIMGRSMATSQDLATWTCGSRILPEYLLWCLRAMRSDLLQRLAFGSTHKTIYMPDLQSLRVPLPDVSDQRRIVARIREMNADIDDCVDSIDQQLELLSERRSVFISAVLNGGVDVTTARGVEV